MSPLVGVIMGSASDLFIMKEAINILKRFAVPFEVEIVSAHRTPKKMMSYAQTARERGLKVIIAGAGGAAHLPGMIASLTILPVIGVPIKSKNSIDGWDSVLSILQMPMGVPVATVALNGSANAAILASQIIALSDHDVATHMETFKREMKKKVQESNQTVQIKNSSEENE